MTDTSTSSTQELLRGAILATDHDERYRLTAEVGRRGVDPTRDVPLLIELLDADHWFSVSLAVWELAKLGPDAHAAVPKLLEVIGRDTIIDPRWVSLWAIERIGPAAAAAAPAVLAVLRDDHDADVRSEAAFALGSIGTTDEVVAALAAALDDEDSLVREEAATALGRIGPPAVPTADVLLGLATTDAVRAVRAAAFRALKRLGEHTLAARAEPEVNRVEPPAVLPDLLDRLHSEDARVRAESAWPIGKYGADAAPGTPIIARQLREDKDSDARWGAAWCLGRIGPPAVGGVAAVISATRHDPDPDVRAEAAEALGLIGNGSADVVATLIGALGDDSASFLREEAATALGRLGASSIAAVPALRQRLSDSHPMVRLRAEAALVTIQGY